MRVHKVRQLCRAIRWHRQVRRAVSTQLELLENPGTCALGSLDDADEARLAELVRRAADHPGPIVECGTLFGLTTRLLAARARPGQPVISIDNFSWNPFGLPPAVHESFARKVLRTELAEGRVVLEKADSATFRATYRGPRPRRRGGAGLAEPALPGGRREPRARGRAEILRARHAVRVDPAEARGAVGAAGLSKAVRRRDRAGRAGRGICPAPRLWRVADRARAHRPRYGRGRGGGPGPGRPAGVSAAVFVRGPLRRREADRLPIACTAACGSSVELVRSSFNGRVVGPGDVAGLADALEWLHAHEADLRWIGERGMPLAAPYAKEIWADRILALCGRRRA